MADAPADRPSEAEGLIRARGGRREFVPMRRSFLQKRVAGGGAGPLAEFVRTRRKRALDLYLLIHALASSPPFDVALAARDWASALGMADSPSSRVFISKTLSWLETGRLLRSEQDGIRRRVYLLDESGSGAPYRHSANDRRPDYFKLPHAYWFDGWHARLDLPATAALLVALSLRTTFVLPHDHAARWYGVSPDTLRRGLRQLVKVEILSVRELTKRAPNSPTGATLERHYTLQGAFASTARRSAGAGRAQRAS